MPGRERKCDFCQGDGYIEDEYGEWKLEDVTITPLPAIDLETGERDESAEPEYHALFLKYLDEEYGKGEQGSFPINFCPVCGRQLNENYPTHYAGGNLILSKSDWDKFLGKLRDPETIRRRDKFFAALDAMEIKRNNDGSYEVPFEPKPKKAPMIEGWPYCRDCVHGRYSEQFGAMLCHSPQVCIDYSQYQKKEE